MHNQEERFIPKYFAAANSYGGFISFFDEIFKPEEYTRIYVLKGGPGTGKSSLMKKISKDFFDKGFNVEEIYCSSDPNSLDGVIVIKGNKKIAIIDGTAPHEQDAKIPVAFDKIINLAEGLDERLLLSQRDEILSLVKEKRRAYQTAYHYLSSAGKSDSFIRKIYQSNFNRNKAKSKAEAYLQDIMAKEEGVSKTRLISSFGRAGEAILDSNFRFEKRLIKVGGSEYSTALFLDFCEEILSSKNADMTLFRYCLNPRCLDAISIPDCSTTIMKSDDFEIDADDLVSIPPIENEQIRVAKMMRIDALDEARRWFTIASDLHFRLEKIYSSAMNFEKNNELLIKITEEITTLFEKEI